MKHLQVELVKHQYWVKHKGLRVVLIFEGRDAAGKGGTISASPRGSTRGAVAWSPSGHPRTARRRSGLRLVPLAAGLLDVPLMPESRIYLMIDFQRERRRAKGRPG